MKLGFYTFSYIDRLKMDIDPVLEAVVAAGYDGIDISATWHDDLDPACMPSDVRNRYVAAAGRLGLEVEAVITHLGLVQALRDGLPINLQGAVDVARDIGARIVTFHIGEVGDRPQDDWQMAVHYLRKACDYAGRHGKVVALDGVWGPSLVSTPERAVRLAEDVGSPYFGHNYDPCYLAVTGFDLARATPPLLPRTVHVHVKDYVGRYPAFEHRIPGEGVLDHASYLRLLKDARYEGYIVNECFIDAPFERACLAGYQTLATALRACGARPQTIGWALSEAGALGAGLSGASPPHDMQYFGEVRYPEDVKDLGADVAQGEAAAHRVQPLVQRDEIT
jgi:sugar phosphate isomerase/epimerase